MSDLTIRAVAPDEINTAAQLVANTLSGNQRDRSRMLYDTYANRMMNRPGIMPSPYRAAFRKNRLVSLAHVIDFRLRYGRAALKVVGVGIVCTHSSYRRRGYASAVIKDTLTFAAEQGAHLVLLQGNLPSFYQRFGFSPVWPHYTLQFPAQEAAQIEQPSQLRVATPSDLPMMARLYNTLWGSRVTIERPFDIWRWRMTYSRGEAVVIVNKAGTITGYIWHLPDNFSERVEVVVANYAAIKTALAYSGRRWQAGKKNNVLWAVPPDDIIVPYSQQILPMTLSASYAPAGGWMARVIDLHKLLHELMPEIIAQAKATHSDFDPQQLILKIEPDGVSIGLQHIPTSHCHLSLRDFIQLVFGSLRPEMLAIREPLTPKSIQLLDLLFPPRIAALAAWDWY